MSMKYLAKTVLPRPIHRGLRRAYRETLFRVGLRQLRAVPPGEPIPAAVFWRVIYGWGNEGWSTDAAFATASMDAARGGAHTILECGSGLSTVLVGIATQGSGADVVALEHVPAWAARVRRTLERLHFGHVRVEDAPLRSYGAFDWYDVTRARLPRRIDLVLCDGPPGDVPGGRYGLVPILGERLAAGGTILLDDVARPSERAILERWCEETGGRASIEGSRKPFARLRLP